MPAIVIHSIEMTDDQKRVLADKLISAFSEVTNVPKDRVYIFFNGYGLNECGTAGKIFTDLPPGPAHHKFNASEWEKKE
jgi:4-oxalocrotonate tautomerase